MFSFKVCVLSLKICFFRAAMVDILSYNGKTVYLYMNLFGICVQKAFGATAYDDFTGHLEEITDDDEN